MFENRMKARFWKTKDGIVMLKKIPVKADITLSVDNVMSAFTVCITYPVLLMHEMQYIRPAIKWCLDKDTLHHVSSLCQSINVQLRNLRRIKRYLDKDTLHHVVRVWVLSRIDYSNLLLFGSTSYELDRVQRLQNSAAPLICSTPLR